MSISEDEIEKLKKGDILLMEHWNSINKPKKKYVYVKFIETDGEDYDIFRVILLEEYIFNEKGFNKKSAGTKWHCTKDRIHKIKDYDEAMVDLL